MVSIPEMFVSFVLLQLIQDIHCLNIHVKYLHKKSWKYEEIRVNARVPMLLRMRIL